MFIIKKVNNDSELIEEADENLCRNRITKERGEHAVYIEKIFLINVIMDLYLLKITSCVLGKQVGNLRLAGASVLGAAGYCLVLCMQSIPYELGIFIGLIPIGMLIVKVSCRTKGWKELLYGTGYLFTFSFLLGGFIIFLKGKIQWFRENNSSSLILAGAGGIGYILLQYGVKFLKKKRQNHFCTVEFMGDTGILSVAALIDTGNGLMEPISHKPVAVLAESEWNNLSRWKKPEKYKAIPFHSIGQDRGMMEGYEIDEIEVKGDMGSVRYKNVIVAISTRRLSGNGSYQMILPPELSI